MTNAPVGGVQVAGYFPGYGTISTVPQYSFRVNWNGDGVTYVEEAPNMLSCQTHRGADPRANLTSRAGAGSCAIQLRNSDGRYSEFNPSSGIFGNILPIRRVLLEATNPTAGYMFTGWIDSMEPRGGGIPTATLKCVGAFAVMGNQTNSINPAAVVGGLTSDAIGACLDATPWPAANRIIETGLAPLGPWFKSNASPLPAMQELEETELGFLYEGLNWDFVFENRYHRVTATPSTVSQATFSDVPGAALPFLINISQANPIQRIFNKFSASYTPSSGPAAVAVLWTYMGPQISLSPGTSVTLTASVSAGFAFPWTTPVVGTDVVLAAGLAVNGNIIISASQHAASMDITITNNDSHTSTFSLVQARGALISFSAPVGVSSQDATSISKYLQRAYPLQSPWYFNAAYAQAGCDYGVSVRKDPHPLLSMTIPAGASSALFAQAVSRQISDRITVIATQQLTELGINGDFFVEAIDHKFSIDPPAPLETTFLISAAAATTHYFTFDVDKFDVGVLAY